MKSSRGGCQSLTYQWSAWVQVMAWCRQATSHYLSQFRPQSMSHKSVVRPQWVKKFPQRVQKCWNNKVSVATGLAEKSSLTFPWHFPDCQHKFQSLSRYIPCGNFCNIPNHIEITLFTNRCLNIVVLKRGQYKRTLSTSWKLSISCAEYYAKHENK